MRGLIVFIKNPELGKVKTRLAQTMGDEKALEIYNKLVGYTRNIMSQVSGVKKYVFYSSYIDNSDDWENNIFDKRLQSKGGLGEKITTAVESVFSECDQVVIIGSDCPQLLPQHLEESFRLLEDHNLVIGPSVDGGYYLMGMDNFYPELFTDINWSTETVLAETLEKSSQQNLSTTLIEKLSDIDFEEDWEKFGF